jgi:hypothetical protein
MKRHCVKTYLKVQRSRGDRTSNGWLKRSNRERAVETAATTIAAPCPGAIAGTRNPPISGPRTGTRADLLRSDPKRIKRPAGNAQRLDAVNCKIWSELTFALQPSVKKTEAA